MITHLKGSIDEISPAHVVVDCGGVGYFAHISLNTYSRLKESKNAIVFTQHIVREDAEMLFGFADRTEREMFRLLTGVSGIGPSSARMILSAMTPEEVQRSISHGDVRAFKSVKGIGEKSAQRIIVDLRDKAGSLQPDLTLAPAGSAGAIKAETLAALIALGFARPQAEKAIDKALADADNAESTEKLLKIALKFL
ncbi:MAG: Holliday junction branch migration protein RuvA [Bacteroidia bacterium]|nr:Holliday junction branch migration protein RuvA [Bacteroidia bacterium]